MIEMALANLKPCPDCRGRGRARRGASRQYVTCKPCSGTGNITMELAVTPLVLAQNIQPGHLKTVFDKGKD